MTQRNNTPGKEDWYTPGYIIRACEKVFGISNFGFDPCSCEEANREVRADVFFTKDDDALSATWPEGDPFVWMNPPYTRGAVGAFAERFLAEGCQGAVLINSTTDTKAWQALASEAQYIFFPNRRIAFISDGVPVKGNTLPQTLFLYGWPDQMSPEVLAREIGGTLLGSIPEENE